jgi:NTE family protein
MNASTPRLALVLAGGGARGAYEAGALRFIMGDLPLQMGNPVLPRIICGTSVGAINGAWTAAHLGAAAGAHQLSKFWRTVTLEEVYRFVALDLLRSPMRIFRGTTDETKSLVDATPLHTLIRDRFPESRLREVVASGQLDALVIAATETQGGQCVHFVDGARAHELTASGTDKTHFQTEITAEHILASCAIPFLFPSIQIEGRALIDGSLRQNTPLRPALALGATHCLVIGTKGDRRPPPPLQDVPENEEEDPTVPFLLGKMLNALLLDPVHADIQRLELVNQVLRTGRATYGDDFADRMNTSLPSPLREIEVLYLRPSRDLGRVAAEVWDASAIGANRATRMLLSTIADRAVDGEADLLSYLLFDRVFSSAIEQLGYEDAVQRAPEITAFLTAASARSTT